MSYNNVRWDDKDFPSSQWNRDFENRQNEFFNDEPPLLFKIAICVFPFFILFVIIVSCFRCCRALRNSNNRNIHYRDETQDITNTWISNEYTTYPFHIPNKAVLAGKDVDGADIYVGRSLKNGDWIVTKIIPSANKAFCSWGGDEIQAINYEYLCGENYEWMPSSNGIVHNNAVSPGSTKSGEKLFIGRGHWRGSLTPGKIHPSHGCLYIPFDGHEIAIKDYEVLMKSQDSGANVGFGRLTNSMLSSTAPVVVTSSTYQTATNYPTTTDLPTGGYQPSQYAAAVYPIAQPSVPTAFPITTPYPPGVPIPQTLPPCRQLAGYPHPQPTGYQQQPGNMAPYPPPAASDPNSNPPSYDQVVGSESYNKQAAYNPHYTAN